MVKPKKTQQRSKPRRKFSTSKTVGALIGTLAAIWAAHKTYLSQRVEQPCRQIPYELEMAIDGDFWGHFITGGRIPKEPFSNQRRSPCKGSTVSVNGGCWVRTSEKPPCPDDQFEHESSCYFPVTSKSAGTVRDQ